MSAAAEMVATSKLTPWVKNPRKNDHVVRSVADSIQRFGFANPILARAEDGRVIAGHTRLKAAILLGLAEVPVRYMDLTNEQADALALADNKLGELATWDDAALAEVLAGLDGAAKGLGWTDDELADILRAAQPEPVGDPDEVPEVRAEVVSVPGEVYELGPHRLICGDCRNPDDVARLLGSVRVALAFTSPPYASQREYDPTSGFKPIPPDEFVDWFEPVQANVARHLAPDGSWFVNIKPHSEGLDVDLYVLDLVAAHVRRWGWHFATEYCWERTGLPGKPVRRFKNQFEPVYQFARNDWKFRPDAVTHASDNVPAYSPGSRMAPGLGDWQGSKGKDVTKAGRAYPGNRLPSYSMDTHGAHKAAFPTGLPAFFVQAYTDPGDAVYEPFCGSGTTLIAAAMHGRVGYGVEISAQYCDVIRRRWTRWARENGQDPGPGALE